MRVRELSGNPDVPCHDGMKPMHFRQEQNSGVLTGAAVLLAPRRLIWGSESIAKSALKIRRQRACDKASPAAAVMLHLRSRYVSKAAILTIPVSLVPVENRSPA